jgi:CelD/BcsL family acetyltransferase involved in cellulose biosynthesis
MMIISDASPGGYVGHGNMQDQDRLADQKPDALPDASVGHGNFKRHMGDPSFV